LIYIYTRIITLSWALFINQAINLDSQTGILEKISSETQETTRIATFFPFFNPGR
jgi:hypothetical protein